MKRCLALSFVVLVGVFVSTPVGNAGQGSGNPVLVVEPVTISPTGVTEVTVRGYDYLVPPHAPGTSVFGGVYVMFGWVANPNAFGPSLRNSNNNNGTFGVSYLYPGTGGDANLRDDGSGLVRLVSFTPGGESGGATDYHMDPEGNWVTHIKVFGSSFSGYDPRTGQTFNVDCLQVQCGVMTIGAHGKISATNEKFTPINFRSTSTTTTPTTSTTSTASSTLPTSTSSSTPSSTTTTTRPVPTTSVGQTTTTGAGNVIPPTTGPGETTQPTNSGAEPTTTVPATEVQDGQVIATDVVSTRDMSNTTLLALGVALVLGLGGVGLWLRKRRQQIKS